MWVTLKSSVLIRPWPRAAPDSITAPQCAVPGASQRHLYGRPLGKGASRQKSKGTGASDILFCFEKSPSGSGGKWQHCSALDDRAWSRGCLNGDITAGSRSPAHPWQGRGTGRTRGAPGRQETSFSTRRSCTASQNASFHTNRMPPAVCASTVSPSHPCPPLSHHLHALGPVQGHPEEVNLEPKSIKGPYFPCTSWKTCPTLRGSVCRAVAGLRRGTQ